MNKRRAGVTLLELIVAISLLTAATAPLLAVMVSSFHSSAQAQEMKNASFAAQQVMEELIGRSWNGHELGADPGRFNPFLVHFNWGVAQSIEVSGRRYYFVATHNGTLGNPHLTENYGRILAASASSDEQVPLLQVTVCIHATNPGDPTSGGATPWSAAWGTALTSGGLVPQNLRPENPKVSHSSWINTAPGGFVPSTP